METQKETERDRERHTRRVSFVSILAQYTILLTEI